MNLSRLILIAALVAVALLFVSGSGTRFGLWAFPVGFRLLKWAAYLGLGAAAVALVGLVVPKLRAGQGPRLVVSLALGLGVAAVPAYWLGAAGKLPPIHDISTDLADPPAFVAVLPARGPQSNPAEHAGAAVADAQRAAYPDIRPLILALPPVDAFALALRAARAMGWEIVAQDPAAGRIEATATTLWFGFRDDVVVRVTPADGGSRIDVRSLSRVGVGDVGANAKRIRTYLSRIAD
ncbi:DUF1499 domain-containing protein [Aromatoleum sp.]|uniref:DUF1499 domain-containing protein n=1 Tax=Aromatoleum sp. TaxID=2307007 RepID=UPI002FC904B8